MTSASAASSTITTTIVTVAPQSNPKSPSSVSSSPSQAAFDKLESSAARIYFLQKQERLRALLKDSSTPPASLSSTSSSTAGDQSLDHTFSGPPTPPSKHITEAVSGAAEQEKSVPHLEQTPKLGSVKAKAEEKKEQRRKKNKKKSQNEMAEAEKSVGDVKVEDGSDDDPSPPEMGESETAEATADKVDDFQDASEEHEEDKKQESPKSETKKTHSRQASKASMKSSHKKDKSLEIKLPEPEAEAEAEARDAQQVKLSLDVQSVSPFDGPPSSPEGALKANGTSKDATAEEEDPNTAKRTSKNSEEISLPPTPQQMDEVDAALDGEASSSSVRPPSPHKRNFTSPFNFFRKSSSSSAKQKIVSPPSTATNKERRDTMSSQATMSTVTSDTHDGDNASANGTTSKHNKRHSLKDRFKLARLQQEAGISLVEEGKDNDADVRSTGDVSTRPSTAHGGDAVEATSPLAEVPVNEGLAPGTAAGAAKGPATETDGPVDWDLWQAVVYEGPAAVQRTSPAELNKAITNGIPSAIRGVVWQVLASSKNEALEEIYRDLVARRSPEPERQPSISKIQQQDQRSESPSTVSYASSIRSEEPSSPATQTGESGLASPVLPHDGHSIDEVAKAAAKEVEEEKRRAKEVKEAEAALLKLERAIKRDLGSRTSFSKFLMSAGLQDGLFGICKAYALYDEEIGYAQGMNFIAMPLLFNMPEEEAFCLFVQLMNQYHLRDMFNAEMSGLHLHLHQFARLLEEYEPALYCHLHRRGVHPQLYATQWFLTLFAYRFPLQLVLRIYDLILSEGLETAILKFGLVLMQKNAEKLLSMKDMSALTTFLKERIFDVYIDKAPSASSVLESGFFGSASGIDREVYRADALVEDACAIKITPEMLKEYTTEWEEKTRAEKLKLAEEEALRNSNVSLTAQVKSLTERSEKYDEEHVQLASELVKTKVENQQLHDDNESLRTQVKELRDIVMAQPGEVEEKLRAEMDRIMKRNIEVQNENRHLEEQVAETEAELIKSKMANAETQNEVESIRKKWMNITNMMNAKD